MPGSWDPTDFPGLTEKDYEVKSPKTAQYNCIAWAADDNHRNWWPDPAKIGFWPVGVPREETLVAFQLAFGSCGYMPCDDGLLEEGFEKIAVYVEWDGTPSHAAWQRPDGTWTSKMGAFEDIDHKELSVLSGRSRAYGRPKLYMKRSRRPRKSEL